MFEFLKNMSIYIVTSPYFVTKNIYNYFFNYEKVKRDQQQAWDELLRWKYDKELVTRDYSIWKEKKDTLIQEAKSLAVYENYVKTCKPDTNFRTRSLTTLQYLAIAYDTQYQETLRKYMRLVISMLNLI